MWELWSGYNQRSYKQATCALQTENDLLCLDQGYSSDAAGSHDDPQRTDGSNLLPFRRITRRKLIGQQDWNPIAVAYAQTLLFTWVKVLKPVCSDEVRKLSDSNCLVMQSDFGERCFGNAPFFHSLTPYCLARIARVLEGLAGASSTRDCSEAELGRYLQRLAPRWFIVKNAHIPNVEPVLLRAREAITLMRGPMTRNEILRARQWRASLEGLE